MSGSNVPPYIAYPYDASDLPMKASDLLSALGPLLDETTGITSAQRVAGAVAKYDGTTWIWSDWQSDAGIWDDAAIWDDSIVWSDT